VPGCPHQIFPLRGQIRPNCGTINPAASTAGADQHIIATLAHEASLFSGGELGQWLRFRGLVSDGAAFLFCSTNPMRERVYTPRWQAR